MAIALYVHVPFCIKKCGYCSFASIPIEGGDAAGYLKALWSETGLRAGMLLPEEKRVDTIYVGGGTPTCLTGDELAGIMERIFSCFEVAGDAEITVEANPGTVDFKKLAILKKAGFNRLSLGVQACREDLLKTLGRIHSFSAAVSTLAEAREAGFQNINVDLIFGIPGQTLEQWEECLEGITGLGPEHLSAYGLQVEEGTPLFDRIGRGELFPCDEDLEADMYLHLMQHMKSRGYVHYEISNFALPGRECRHNLCYWRNKSYLGLGPAAHSNLRGRRFSNHAGPGVYAEMLMEGHFPECWEERIDTRTEMSETAFLGLRLLEGLDIGEFRKRFGRDILEVYGREINRLTVLGLVEMADGRIRLTPRGLMMGNVVFAEFIQ